MWSLHGNGGILFTGLQSRGYGGRYYQYANLSDEADFAAYVEQVQKAALYDTGVKAQYGEQLLTLSTCSYHTDDGRFVVVAKKQEWLCA